MSDTRKNNYDFLRFFFASLVILSHSYLLLRSDGVGADPLWFATGTRMSFGSLAVACFFAISGFLITQSWLGCRNITDYFKKRALRIYPGWIAALLFGIVAGVGPLLLHHMVLSHAAAVLQCFDKLLLYGCGSGQYIRGVGTINGSTWTIPFEILCYILVVVLGQLGLLRARLVSLLLTLSLLFYVTWAVQTRLVETLGPHVFYFGDLRCLPVFALYFLAGMMIYLFRECIPHSVWLLGFSLILVALTLVHGPLARLFFLLLPTFGFYILFYLAFLPALPLHNFARHGDLSYGVYLYAFPLQKLVVGWQQKGYHLTPLTLFLVTWFLACGVAVLSWRFVERPFLKLKPKSQRPPTEDSGVPAVSAPETIFGA